MTWTYKELLNQMLWYEAARRTTLVEIVDQQRLTTAGRFMNHEGGSVTETYFYLFGTGGRGGLTVLEKKKIEEGVYEVTLAHYFGFYQK